MERLEIAGGDVAVAAAALIHDVQAEIGKIGALDAVRGMAVGAHREFLVSVGDFGGVDAGGKQLVDAAVALRAGAGDVGAVDAGARVGGGQFVVRGMAVGAIRRHGQPAFHQPLSMNALQVIFDHVVLRSGVAQGGLLAGAVTLAAERRHVARKGGRDGVFLAQHAMRAVAILAAGRIGAPLRGQFAVRAFAVLGHYFRVADGAVHLVRDGPAGAQVRRRPAGVALDAGGACVARVLQFGLVHEQRDGPAAAGDLQVAVAVAALAILVRHALRIEHRADLMRLVAVHAGGNQVRLLFP